LEGTVGTLHGSGGRSRKATVFRALLRLACSTAVDLVT
jgi:hypothetical protein